MGLHTTESIVNVDEGCMVCSHKHASLLGVRGNREYYGADPNAEPHLHTNVVMCLNCEFIYLVPRIPGTVALEKEHYSNPMSYEAVIGGSSSEMFKCRLKFIERFKSPSSLLDVGAGKGEFLSQALHNGWDVDGLEPSKPFCEYAKRQFNLEFYNGLLENYVRVERKEYSVITLNHVLEHVENPYTLLNNVKNLLDSSGVLFIEVPNTTSNLLKLADLYFKFKGLNWSSRLSPMHPPFHEFGYNKTSLQYLLGRSGFVIIESKTFSGRARGYSKNGRSKGISTILRSLSGRIMDLFGNRELLAIIARKAA